MYLVSQFDPLGFAQILLLLGSFVFSFIVLFHFVCNCSFSRGTAELGEVALAMPWFLMTTGLQGTRGLFSEGHLDAIPCDQEAPVRSRFLCEIRGRAGKGKPGLGKEGDEGTGLET